MLSRNVRFASAPTIAIRPHDLLDDLDAARQALAPSQPGATRAMTIEVPRQLRTARWVMAGATAVVVMAAAWWMLSQRVRANEISQTVADLHSLVASEKFSAAFRLLHTLRPEIAGDPAIAKAARDYLLPLRVTTDPPGADVFVKGYDEPDAPWIPLGAAPLDTRSLLSLFRWRISKQGFDTFEGSGPTQTPAGLAFTLTRSGTMPPGMVRVADGDMPAFFIDKHEVTNKAYKAFIDAGGYRTAAYWPASTMKDGHPLSWQQLVGDFKDTTGRPAPSTWELGSYPPGQDDFPVSGISWFEAMAYAKFAGKSVPTVHHWRQAAGQGIYSQILGFSNFTGKTPVRVGSLPSLGPWGTYDMAGNVKEWCENEVAGKRYTLGGGWNEPNYQYRAPDARSPFDRQSNLGVRLMVAPDPAAVPATAHGTVPMLYRDYGREQPVNDQLFTAFVRAYAYDNVDSAGKTESVNETDAWRVERVCVRGIGHRPHAGVLVPAKECEAPVPNGGVFPAFGQPDARLISAGGDGVPRIPREERPRTAVPDVLRHLRAAAQDPSEWTQRVPRLHHQASCRSAAIGRLPGDA